MPAGSWNLGRLDKRTKAINLAQFDSIKIIDESANSTDYFNIVEMPDRFTSGKNLFKLNAAPLVLVDKSKIWIEIFDYNGANIYWEPLTYVEQDGTRVVSVYIFPDKNAGITTSPGPATIYIAGRAKYNVQTGEPLPYSNNPTNSEYHGNPNVLWQHVINVAPEKQNSSQIIHTRQPTMTIIERVVPYQKPIRLENVNVIKSGSVNHDIGQVIIEGIPDTSATNMSTYAAANTVSPMTYEGATSPHTPTAYAGIPSAPIMTVSYPSTAAPDGDTIDQLSEGITEAAIFEQTTDIPEEEIAAGPTEVASAGYNLITGYSRIQTTDLFPLSESMEGGFLILKNPFAYAQPGTPLNTSGQIMPAIKYGDESIGNLSSGGYHPLSGSYLFRLLNVENTTKATVAQVGGPGHQLGAEGAFTFLAQKSLNNAQISATQISQPESYTIKSISASANFSSSHTEPYVTINTDQSQSFAEIILANIEPATGDVYKIKTLYKAGGQFGDFIDAGDTILERFRLLEDKTAYENIPAVGMIYNRMGHFTSTADFDTYWHYPYKNDSNGAIIWNGDFISTVANNTNFNYVSASNSPLGELDNGFIGYSPSSLMSSIKVDPSTAFHTTASRIFPIQLKKEYRPKAYADSQYTFTIDAAAINKGVNVEGQTEASQWHAQMPYPRIDIYISGSQGKNSIMPRGTNAWRLTNDADYPIEDTLEGSELDDEALGVRIGTIELQAGTLSQNQISFTFISLKNQFIQPNIVIRRGTWSFAKASIETSNETGFTPNHVRLNVKIPTAFINTPLTFKFQYFDYQNTQAIMESQIYPVTFKGDNLVIQGQNNLLTGSLYVGSTVGSGVEASGQNSAFIRSVGYAGYSASLATNNPGKGGFMLYSGSILPNELNYFNSLEGFTDGGKYAGVGLELVTDDDSAHMIFQTTKSLLDIKTDQFFLGNSDSFISMSADGNFGINSDNFTVEAGGDVTLTGTITVTNTEDFADADMHLSSSAIFENFHQQLDAGKFIKVDVSQSLVNTLDNTAGTSISGSKFFNNNSNSAWNSGFFTNSTTFLRSQSPVLEVDLIVHNDGTDGAANNAPTFVGFVAHSTNASDLNTAINIDHILHGVYWYDGDLKIRDDANNNGNSVLEEITIASNASDAPSLSSLGNNFWKARISLKPAGGATYEFWKNGDTTQPYATYNSTANTTAKLKSAAMFYSTASAVIFQGLGVSSNSSPGIQSTRISGDSIQTGKIQNVRFTSGAGSQIDLNEGTIKFGGTEDPKFAVDRKGAVTASAGHVGGWKLASASLSVPGIATISASREETDPVSFISSSKFKVSAGGQITASSALFLGEIQTNAMRNISFTLTEEFGVVNTYLDSDGTLDLSSMGPGSNGVAHVIIDADINWYTGPENVEGADGYLNVGQFTGAYNQGYINKIIPPQTNVGGKTLITLEIAPDRQVDLRHGTEESSFTSIDSGQGAASFIGDYPFDCDAICIEPD
jgi:hypothetical protein